MEGAHPDESDSLLGHSGHTRRYYDGTKRRAEHGEPQLKLFPKHWSVYWVLPVPLLASLAMSVTIATTIYAYAALTCRDPAHCTDRERSKYAGSIAVATSIAHFFGIFVLGPLQRLVKKDERIALSVWIASRALSIVALVIAVPFHTLGVALVGRIFEGAASDNSLHFILNSVYARTTSSTTSRLMGTSLALFMAGMAFGPLFAGLFEDYQVSFAIGGALLLLAAVYAWIFVPKTSHKLPSITVGGFDDQTTPSTHRESTVFGSTFRTLILPLLPYYYRPTLIFHGLSMFLFTAVQSYLFPAIMIHTSIVFNFNSAQTGWIVSIAAAMSALYLLTILYLLPRLRKLWHSRQTVQTHSGTNEELDEDETRGSIFFDSAVFVTCVTIQAIATLSLTWWTVPGPFIAAVAILAIGLGAGSFLKSQLASKMSDGAEAVAALSIVETIGGLASPIIIGSWQALHTSDGTIFILISAMLGGSVVSFLLGTIWL